MHLLFKQRGAGRENKNCVGLKLAKTLALRLAPHCIGCMIGPLVFNSIATGAERNFLWQRILCFKEKSEQGGTQTGCRQAFMISLSADSTQNLQALALQPQSFPTKRSLKTALKLHQHCNPLLPAKLQGQNHLLDQFSEAVCNRKL